MAKLNRTQLLAILAIIGQLVGQLGLTQYAELVQTVGTFVISILVLFGLVQTETVKAALKKAKLL